MEALDAPMEKRVVDYSGYAGLTTWQDNCTIYLDGIHQALTLYNINNMSLLVKDSVLLRDLMTVEESERVAHSLLEKAVKRWMVKEKLVPRSLNSQEVRKDQVTAFEEKCVGILKPFKLSKKCAGDDDRHIFSYGFFFNTEIGMWTDGILPLIVDLFSCTCEATFKPDIIILKTPKVILNQEQFKELTQKRDDYYYFLGINNGDVPLKRWSNEKYDSLPNFKTTAANTIFIFLNDCKMQSVAARPYHHPLREDFENTGNNMTIGNTVVCDLRIMRFLKSESNYVVFLGEGNFSFSAAVASLRKTWRNIVSSDVKEFSSYSALVNNTCQSIIEEYQSYDEFSDVEVIEFISDLYLLDGSLYLAMNIDAVVLENDMKDLVQPRALFFNCPWNNKMYSESENNLVTQFFKSAKNYQDTGNLIFLGITTCKKYIGSYGLFDEALETLKDFEGYVLRGADNTFVRQMIKRGYRHQTSNGDTHIHNTLKDTHVVLVYEKQ